MINIFFIPALLFHRFFLSSPAKKKALPLNLVFEN